MIVCFSGRKSFSVLYDEDKLKYCKLSTPVLTGRLKSTVLGQHSVSFARDMWLKRCVRIR